MRYTGNGARAIGVPPGVGGRCSEEVNVVRIPLRLIALNNDKLRTKANGAYACALVEWCKELTRPATMHLAAKSPMRGFGAP